MYEDRNGTDIYYFYDSNGTPTAIRYYEADGTSHRFFLATNQQGDVIGLYNALGNLVVKYEYDAWGNIISETNATGGTPTSLAQKWSDINPFRYRGYYYDSDTGLYYLQSRYYDAEVGRFISSDALLDTSNLLGFNTFAYCGNNPTNNQDPNGKLFFGTIIGGLVGGAMGALTAVVKGKSVTAGFLTGAATGATIGYICDVVATGGMSAVAGVALCGVAAGVGNAVNQYANYRIEKKNQNQSKNSTNSSTKINSGNQRVPTSSNGKMASECDSFAEYVDCKSIAVSSATAMVFAPLSIAANGLVNSAFIGVDTTGVTGFAAQFIANFAMGANISILQSIIDLF